MPLTDDLRKTLRTIEMAQSEMEIAVTCREAWLPAAYDRELHGRLGFSFAGHTFITIRQTLHREFLLSLCRIWDTNPKAIRLGKIWESLRRPAFWEEVVANRAKEFAKDDFRLLEMELIAKRDTVLALIAKYQGGGACEPILKKLHKQRHENLAHRNVWNEQTLGAVTPPEHASDSEILTLFADTKLLVQLLLDLFQAVHYDFDGVSKVFAHHAKYFWNGVRSEKVQGHPDFEYRDL